MTVGHLKALDPQAQARLNSNYEQDSHKSQKAHRWQIAVSLWLANQKFASIAGYDFGYQRIITPPAGR